ncbi:MAG: gliding motility-associated ABC transporter ATP-binding subunit GldA [Flavobacteriales bacterium]|nr:gliding motility-associated ABC transporter ATP-binding subunit GldA [Flavobacteriales bacterium]
MSIIVSQVTKNYGAQKALDSVSFEIKPGEVVGFLGPNGAGKSTMMKILTCYIPQTSGDASVCGFDVRLNSMNVKRSIGYLPEHNPLYLDMYVREYLQFVAELHGVKKVSARVEQMVEMVGLGREAHKKIEELSKGYRQRVGLAQAIIHDPSVLILDEPTSGLDPNQLVEIRSLIMEIGKQKTVMLSTHIMQEVEAICSRTIIINKGNVVADKATSELRKGIDTQSYKLTVELNGAIDKRVFSGISGVSAVNSISNNLWEIEVHGDIDIRGEVSRLATEKGLLVLALGRKEQKLEDVFKDLTASK